MNRLLLLLAAALALSSCAGKTVIPDDPETIFPAARVATEFNQDDARFPAKPGTEHQVLGPGDTLKIEIIEDDVVTGDYTVGPDGMIVVPLVGDIPVNGKLRTEVSTEIVGKLGPYYTNPALTLSVASYAPRKAFVLGAVVAPGSQDLVPSDTLLSVLSKAGGPKERFNEREQSLGYPQLARVIRGDAIAFVNLKKLLEGSDTRSNVAIYPGDLIFLPIEGTQTITVLGEVQSPGLIGLGPGMDIIQAVALAGGFTNTADNTRVRVMRGWWTESPQLFKLNYRELRTTKKRIPPLILQDQDIVFVETRGFAKQSYFLSSVTPTMSIAGSAGFSPTGGAAGP